MPLEAALSCLLFWKPTTTYLRLLAHTSIIPHHLPVSHPQPQSLPPPPPPSFRIVFCPIRGPNNRHHTLERKRFLLVLSRLPHSPPPHLHPRFTDDPMLSAEEIRAAGATLPVLSGRRQRESVRASRATNPDGIARGRPVAGLPVGLEYRGRPLRWPRNTIQGGRVLVEGGEVVDTRDESLAKEAMALLESDFADF